MKYSEEEQPGINIVLGKALTVKGNETTAMTLISATSHTHTVCALSWLNKWLCCLFTAYQLQIIWSSEEPNEILNGTLISTLSVR